MPKERIQDNWLFEEDDSLHSDTISRPPQPEEQDNTDELEDHEQIEVSDNLISNSLSQTLHDVVHDQMMEVDDEADWKKAAEIVNKFKPVPWFIWRLSNYVLGSGIGAKSINEGMIIGLKKIINAAARDDVIGLGRKPRTIHEALNGISPDVVASICILYGIIKRLNTCSETKVWAPLLDDALVRAHIGFYVGQMDEMFTPGRGILAGFAGRIGLVIVIALGTEKQGVEAISSLAQGETFERVGRRIYRCDPLKVTAMTLSATGCGRDAAFGTVRYASSAPLSDVTSKQQLKWLASYSIIEHARMRTLEEVSEELWNVLGYQGNEEKEALVELVSSLIQKGHGWNWLLS